MSGKSKLFAALTLDHKRLADIAYKSGDKAKAAKLYSRGGLHRPAAEIYAQLGETRSAVASAFKAVLGEKAEFGRDTTPLQAGELLASAGYHKEAVALFELANSFHSAAKSALKSGQMARAGLCFDRAKLWTRAATCYEKANRPRDATRALEHEAQRLRRELEAGYSSEKEQLLRRVESKRSELLHRMGRSVQAVQVRSEAPKPKPKTPWELEESGDLQAALEGFEQAGEVKEALRLARKIPGFDQKRVAELMRQAGEALPAAKIFAALGFAAEAAEAFEQAGAWREAAERWESIQLYDRAATAFENAGGLVEAGRCYQAAGKSELAKQAFAKVRAAAQKAQPSPAAAPQNTAASPPSSPPADKNQASLSIGQILAERYQILSVLGQGGMARVYRAADKVLGEEVAIKMLPRHFGGSEEYESRLLREVQICRRISHPNIVRVHDVAPSPRGLLVIMELVEGLTLDALLEKRGPLPLGQIRTIIHQLAAGLGEAHSLGIVHRDLKPSNVIVTQQRVKILDFGIARSIAGLETRLTQTGHAIGTPSYMSPEQVEGKELDGRSDLYSLGILTFNLLTATVPFTGDNMATVALAHLRNPAPAPSTWRPNLPKPWNLLIERLLAKKAADRFQNAQEVGKAVVALPVAENNQTQDLRPPQQRS